MFVLQFVLVFKITWVDRFLRLCVISMHMEKYVKYSDDDTQD